MLECTCSMSTYSLHNFSLSLILSHPKKKKKQPNKKPSPVDMEVYLLQCSGYPDYNLGANIFLPSKLP